MTHEQFIGYNNNAFMVRGAIIAITINLERQIDEFLARYFCGDDGKLELMELIISERMEFSNKADAFIQILKKRCLLNKKDFATEYPGIATDFQKIAKSRNDFAHKLHLPPSENDLAENVIILVEFKNSADRKFYSKPEIDAILSRIEKYGKMIEKMNDSENGKPRE